ncbi:uncharacterized protein BDCG_16243 [Blastomyces dermatitidis ER-3]|uniref:Uncharacterized protein n=2 Tax=Ajellomyces dermatitidis TaxID=5039 RepID=F2T9S6_AJEDA|nr:uncharacterized protein BDCG_16243 [Blastomyces dermatitidis ER-3]EGE79989.1 hypothetical protein BDDG_02930 [Blastomyces dermatitidis ATCC 18188]EQL34411.1 hypothetical protein BDFG_03760 [Blastomyces dermatitidis ATCC 26199]OAS99652.1 hypothetical protein BDCG_16243 [Blastomyces dermatitidis ER-3]
MQSRRTRTNPELLCKRRVDARDSHASRATIAMTTGPRTLWNFTLRSACLTFNRGPCGIIALILGCTEQNKGATTVSAVRLVCQQLDEDLYNNCAPFGVSGSYGPPFKIIRVPYGSIVVGKGTAYRLREEVSCEVDIYRILQKA